MMLMSALSLINLQPKKLLVKVSVAQRTLRGRWFRVSLKSWGTYGRWRLFAHIRTMTRKRQTWMDGVSKTGGLGPTKNVFRSVKNRG
jgi:hypothetical protein